MLGDINFTQLLITVADTPPTFTLAINNTSPRLNDVVQLSSLVSDNDNISMIIASWNGTSNGIWANISNISLLSTSSNYTVNLTVGRSRGNTIGFLFYTNDSSVSTFNASNLNTFVVSNTVPNSTSIINATDKNTRNNETIGCTALVDADGDTINYISLFEASLNPPSVVRQNTTSNTFTTNITNESIYFARCDTTDGFDTTIGSSVFNLTMDTQIPIWQQSFVTNGSFYKTSTNITYNCTDSNIFEVNTSTYAYSTGVLLSSSNFTNLTSLGSRTLNLSIDTSVGDLQLNLTRWCGDTKNKKRPMTEWGVSKSSNNRSLQFNHSGIGLQCNITYGTTNPAEKKLLPLNANVSLKMSVAYTNNDYYKIIYDVVAPNTGFISATEFICNQKIVQVYDNLAGHLLIGSGKEKLSYDAQDLIDAGFTVDTKISDDNTFIQVIKKSEIIKGAVVNYDPRADNLNIVENSAIVEIDTGLPLIFILNLTSNTTTSFTNNSFLRTNEINITGNASDKNNKSILWYVNNAPNITAGYQSNLSFNSTITFTDGNYTVMYRANDSAGNELNSSIIGFAIDTTLPIFSTAFNKTAIDNSTIIRTNTDVNISISGLNDAYLFAGNFSHNASNGNWTNISFTPSNTSANYYIIGSGNFTVNQVVGWKFFVQDLVGNVLDSSYTFTVEKIPVAQPNTGGGGSKPLSIATVQKIQEIIKQNFINSSCSIQVIPKSIILNNKNLKENIQVKYLENIYINFTNKLIKIGDLKSAIPYLAKTQTSERLYEKLNITLNLNNNYNEDKNAFAGLLLNFTTCGSYVVPVTIESEDIKNIDFTLDNLIEIIKIYTTKVGVFIKDIIINFIDITEELI